jgi:hypothetical protein
MFYIRHDGNVAIGCFLPRDSLAAEYGVVSNDTIRLDDHRDPVAPRQIRCQASADNQLFQ